MTVRRAFLLIVLAVALIVLAVFGFFYFRDNFFTHYPIKVISARIFRAGQIPWWNLYDGGGQPLAGNPNTLTFYPDNVLYLFLPAHVAFNLHFLIHLILAWFAMRALCRQTGASDGGATFAATMYALSGVAISAAAFYNLVTAIALVPFALWAVERMRAAARPGVRAALLAGAAFGLIGLAGEPVMVVATALCAVIIAAPRLTLRRAAVAAGSVAVAGLIALPQILAYGEIAGEVERARGYSATTVLNASLLPRRIAEIAVGPILGFLTDPGHAEFRARLFSTVFLGIIVVPAVWFAAAGRRLLRYGGMAAVLLLLALGRYNPIVRAGIESWPSLRIVRYPEKFSIALIVALAVIVAGFVDVLSPRWRAVWAAITFVPLAMTAVHGLPIDWFVFYRPAPMPPVRICRTPEIGWGSRPAVEQYRAAVRFLPPIFGAVAGARYALDRSPEGMHSLMSRVVAERAVAAPPPARLRYMQMSGCAVEGALPMAMIVPRAIGIHSVNEEVQWIEQKGFDPHSAALAPAEYANFASPGAARITRYAEGLQDIEVSVTTPGPALLLVNQSYFRAWTARSAGRSLSILPLDIDRLGVIVPAGSHRIALRFGRHRTAVAAAWAGSSAVLLLALLIEVRDRRAGEVERTADDDRAAV